MLNNTPNQPSKLRTKKRVEINDDAQHVEYITTYNTYSQIKFKISMLKWSLCDYSDAYILVNGTIIITGEGDNDAANCAPFIDYISEINNTQIDNPKI